MGMIFLWLVLLAGAVAFLWRRIRKVDDTLRSTSALREAQFLASIRPGSERIPSPSMPSSRKPQPPLR